jgi:hypothetical protein
MTASDQQVRPMDAPPPGPEWMPYPGAGYYEFSHRGKARSVDRTINGKFYRSTELSTRLNNQGYVLVDIRTDDGTKKTITMHTGVLRSPVGEPGPGEETLHGPGGTEDNRWPENIRWGTRPENLADMAANRPPKAPKPRTPCVNHDRCGGFVSARGARRCQECRVELGVAAAALLEEDDDLEKIAQMLNYASPSGIYKLARKYGGLRVYVDQQGGLGVAVDPAVVVTAGDNADRHGAQPKSWLRRVKIWWEAWSADSDGE